MKKSIVSLLLALVMALTLTLPAYAEGGSAASGESITYKNWVDGEWKDETKNANEYTVVTTDNSDNGVTWGAENTTTYYVVSDTKVITGTVTVYGDVHLILCDGKTLTVNGGIVVNSNSTNTNSNLTIYGQENQKGKLEANGNVSNGSSAGIKFDCYGKLTINGGEVKATGSGTTDSSTVTMSHGIYATTSVTINGGKVTAAGGTVGASGSATSGGIYAYNMTVNGGEVTATGGTATGASCKSFGIDSALTVNGGKVEAKGGAATETATATETAADEDTSAQAESYGICTGENIDIVVNGGTVNATGGAAKATSGDAYSYGIYARNDMTVTGGEVEAKGGTAEAAGEDAYAESCGIYVCHYDWDKKTYYGKLTIEGGTVTAEGNKAEAKGEDACAVSYGIFVAEDMTVKGGSTTVNATVEATVEATGENSRAYSYGIYAYGGLNIDGANVTAEGNEANGYYTHSFGIYTENDITFENATIIATAKTANGAKSAYSYGICAYYNNYDSDNDSNLTITNANITAKGDIAEVENESVIVGEEAQSYGIFVAKNMTVNSGEVNATGGAASSGGIAVSHGICVAKNLIVNGGVVNAKVEATVEAAGEAACAYSYGIKVYYNMTVEGGVVKAYGGAATGADGTAESYGIYVNGDYDDDEDEDDSGRVNLTIKSGNVTATGGTATAGDDAYSYGIYVCGCGNMTIESGTVEAKSDTATGDYAYSYGIYVVEDLTINGGTVTATGGNATATGDNSWPDSYGIYVYDKLTINGGTVKGTGQGSTGEYAVSWGICGLCDLTIKGGTVIAETTETDDIYNKYALLYESDSTYTLPDAYWWRTAKSGAYSQFPSTAYVYNSAHTYVEITTTEQETSSDTDSDSSTTDDDSDNTGSGGGIYHFRGNQTAEVKAPETFDPGIAAYVVMGGISTVTSAAWLRRRKK